jgi:catechol 2,3-dioxygenase-like lactoylglutathione lyase family enzyme
MRYAHDVQGGTVTLILNHTVVHASDKELAARFFADLLGLDVGAPVGPFTPVRVNVDLTLDFDHRGPAAAGHFGFLVDDATFDALLERLHDRPRISFGSGPERGWDRRINRLGGGRGVYVGDPDGHSYEFFTAVPE